MRRGVMRRGIMRGSDYETEGLWEVRGDYETEGL